MSQYSPGQNNPQYNQPDLFSQNPVAPNYSSFNQGGKGSGNKKLLIILGIVGGLCFLVCCGGGVGVLMLGVNLITEDIKNQVRDHPIIEEHIGDLTSFEVSIVKSSAADDPNTFVYTVEGTKGTGELTVTSVSGSDGGEEIASASLRMSSGETYELDFDN